MKMKFCRIGILLITVLMTLPCLAFAQDHYVVGLRANQSTIEVDGEALMDLSPNPAVLTLGADGVYNSDDYNFVSARALMGSNMLTKGLTGNLGFKGVVGTAERRGPDSNLINLGFMISASYDLSDAFPDYIVPVVL